MMIRYPAALLLLMLLCCLVVRSQSVQLRPVPTYPLAVTDSLTTHLLFPLAIRSIDRGSIDLLAQKMKGAEHILQVKAAHDSMAPTSLSVMTIDGKFYSFRVRYDERPVATTIQADDLSAEGWPGVAAKLRALPPRFHQRTNSDQLQLRLQQLFIDSTRLWFTFRLHNFSHVPFDPSIQRYFIKERRTAKRTAVQERELTPLYADPLRIIGYTEPVVLTLAFPAFTIKRSQRFYVQLGERNGARLLTLPIKWKTLLKAKPF